MANNQLTDNQLTKIIESAETVISALAGTNEDVHPDNSTEMCRLYDWLNDNDAPPEVVLAMAREIQEHRKADVDGLVSRELLKRAKQLMYQSGGAPIENSLNPIDAFLFDAEWAALQEHRKAAEPELKLANLVNKFYERYPIASFKSDTERAAALGYFMAGAELQCFGEFIKYEELCGDE
ncbi:hypothetical protein G5642_15190 [Citrobacter freundii]|nr:hypothetical protein [Citrobacter freundii]